ncbi:MAG: HAMP domain-containing protein, partial [Treponema sp.]|nr:HAMP domain-containing protein [Treponema sp.]
MKIGKKLIIMIVALAFSGIGVLLGTILNNSQKQITRLINSELKNLAEKEASQIALWLNSCFDTARAMAQSMEAYEQINEEDRRFFYNVLLKQMAVKNPEITAVWCCWEPNTLDGFDARYANTPGTDHTGRFISYWARTKSGIELESLKNYTVSGSGDFYLLPLQSGNETIAEPYFYSIDGTNTLITSLSVPIKNDGKTIAVAGVDIALNMIQHELADINPYDNSIAMAFSNGGHVAGHSDSSRLGKPMATSETDLAGTHLTDLINAVKAGSPYVFVNDIDIKGIKGRYMVITVPFSVGGTAAPWALGIGVPQKVMTASVLKMLRTSAIISAVILLAIAAVAFLIARSVSKPLKSMALVFTGIGEGDLTKQLDVRRKDEIGDMAVVFNGTLHKIRDLVVTIKNQSVALFDIGNELASNMTETAAAVNEITANIQSIKGRVINQSAGVTETNSTMEQITVNIDKLKGHVDHQGESVAQSSSAIEEMLANIQSVAQTLTQNADNVKELTEASEVGRSGLQEVA